jgi:bacillithiol system protein YtxJ
MQWKNLQEESQLQQIITESAGRPQLIFKYSNRCSISDVAKSRIEKNYTAALDFYFLDLITYRSLSNKVSELFNVYHESPQVLLIKNGECIYDESHLGIRMGEILEQLSTENQGTGFQ